MRPAHAAWARKYVRARRPASTFKEEGPRDEGSWSLHCTAMYLDATHPGVRLPNRMRRPASFAILLALLAALPSAAVPRKKPVEASAPAAETFAEMTSGLERRA